MFLCGMFEKACRFVGLFHYCLMRKYFIFGLILSAFFCAALAQPAYREIVVKRGETLTTIARDNLADPARWRELLQYNKIENPNLIQPGMRLKVPDNLDRQPDASLMRVTGRVDYQKFGQTDWSAAATSQHLFNKDTIRTAGNARAEIRLKNGVTIQLNENSQVEVGGNNATDGPMVRRGRLQVFTGGPVGNFQVRSPTAIASVRGTAFQVDVDENENSSFSCTAGKVAVAAGGATVEILAGFGTVVEKGKPPSAPYKLLDPPAIER